MIDLRDFDQEQHGTRAQKLRVDLLEPTVDQDMAQRIRDVLDVQVAKHCRERYERERADRERA